MGVSLCVGAADWSGSIEGPSGRPLCGQVLGRMKPRASHVSGYQKGGVTILSPQPAPLSPHDVKRLNQGVRPGHALVLLVPYLRTHGFSKLSSGLGVLCKPQTSDGTDALWWLNNAFEN